MPISPFSRFIRAHYAMLGLIVAFFLSYTILAWYAHPNDEKWVFDAVEALLLFAIDDAYRFFESRAAWHHADGWSWAYLLPADMFFKGVLHTITNSNIFLMRLGHAFINMLGLFMLYQACLYLGVRKWLAVVSVSALLMMPVFIIGSMSFYGESLLTALFGFMIFFHLTGRRYAFCVVASLAPLAQPQGLFLLLPFFVFYLRRRDYFVFLMLGTPGFCYFLYILSVHGSLFEYLNFTQLHKFYPAVPVPMQERGWYAAWITFNPFWVFLAALGGVILIRRGQWVIFASVAGWFLMVAFVMNYRNGYEPRYLLPCLPVMALMAALSAEWVASLPGKKNCPVLGSVCAALMLALPALENLAQSDPIRSSLFAGKRWPLGEPEKGMRYFAKVLSHNSEWGLDAAARLSGFFHSHSDIKLLIVNQHDLFYYLDRRDLPEDVRVVYTPFVPAIAYAAFSGVFYVMSPDRPQVELYQFSEVGDSGVRAVFVGDLSPLGWPVAYENRLFNIHEITASVAQPPSRVYYLRSTKGVSERHYTTPNNCPDEIDFFCPNWSLRRIF